MKNLWSDHKLLVLGFGFAVFFTIFLSLRVVGMAIYWSQHQDAEIADWMTIGYIAHSYDVPRQSLIMAIGMEGRPPFRLTLRKISEMQSIPMPVLEQTLMDTIIAERAK